MYIWVMEVKWDFPEGFPDVVGPQKDYYIAEQ